MAKRYQNTLAQASNNSGNSIANATLTFYESGTSNLANTYQDNALTSANTNPVEAGGNGRFGDIFLQAIDYRVVLKDAAGNVLDDQDPFDGRASSSDNVVATIASLKALSKPADGTVVTVSGYYAKSDGGGGQFVYDATSTDVANDGTIIITDAGGAGRWLRMVDDVKSVKMFGAKGDGTTDDTLAIKSAFDSLADGDTLDFLGETYLVAYQGTAYASVYGYVIGELSGLNNITIRGDKATIKCVNHNITTNGGLRFANLTSCHNIKFIGLLFDMTFTGVNTSVNFYPFCGAVTAIDTPSGSSAQSALNQNIDVEDCHFKLYHPWGAFATSGTAGYLGDPNNGYKIFSIFMSGDYLAAAYDNQTRGFKVVNSIWQDGHNGYGIWGWAVNNMQVEGCTSESWVTKYSNHLGVFAGATIPFIRYHQWRCEGLDIINNNHRAKPCDERTASGFEGVGSFCNINSGNESIDISTGLVSISGNTIILGRGDSANTTTDRGVNFFNQGSTIINDNTFSSTTATTNAYAEVGISWNSESNFQKGDAVATITSNTFGENLDYCDNITIANGVTTAASDRRLKKLTIANNTSIGQLQYFININSTSTYYGVQDVLLSNNIIDGSKNTVFNSASTNSRTYSFASSETSDLIVISNDIVRDKYYLSVSSSIAGVLTMNDMVLSGLTTRYIGKIPVSRERGTGTPEGAIVAAVGSTFYRDDGGVGTSFYVKESGTGNTGWIGK